MTTRLAFEGAELPPEIAMLKDTIRKFVDRELIPIERSARDGHKLKPDVLAKLRERGREIGLDCFDIPEEFGGLGLGLLAKLVVLSELSRSIALPSRGADVFGPAVSPVLYRLVGAQRERFLAPTLRGELKWCFAQTESDAGGDPSRIKTRATRHGDGYRLIGTKRYITGADDADMALVIAATDPAKGSRGMSAFIVDMKSPGLSLIRPEEMMVDDRPWEIGFDDVEVPVGNRVGEEGDGFKIGQSWITIFRLRHGARSIGVIERCLEMSIAYANERVTFGKPLSDHQAIQWMIAESYMDLHMLRLLVYRAATRFDAGLDVRQESYMAKIFGDERSFLAADRCLEIHGGVGLSKDMPIETFWRDQRSMMITEGPNPILKATLARDLLHG